MIKFPRVLILFGLVALAACAAVEPSEVNLRESFAAQIAAVDGVEDFTRDGDELTFTGPDGEGGTASWRVSIDSAALEPGPNETTPFAGHIISTWYRNDEEVVFLGNMSALPPAFLETGVAQECYALWDAESSTWGWT